MLSYYKDLRTQAVAGQRVLRVWHNEATALYASIHAEMCAVFRRVSIYGEPHFLLTETCAARCTKQELFSFMHQSPPLVMIYYRIDDTGCISIAADESRDGPACAAMLAFLSASPSGRCLACLLGFEDMLAVPAGPDEHAGQIELRRDAQPGEA